ncbi:hypothetical protein N665_0455s0015 [Sinapis alba]|nr:hypothetical protein N665_0455s0015 [Sinapis alba]
MKENRWLSGAPSSALLLVPLTTGDKPPLDPPWPPDPHDPPSSSLSLSLYPPLSASVPKTSLIPCKNSPTTQRSNNSVNLRDNSSKTIAKPLANSDSAISENKSLKLHNPRSTVTVHEQYKILPPKTTSPIQTNKASSSSISPPLHYPNPNKTQSKSLLPSPHPDTEMVDSLSSTPPTSPPTDPEIHPLRPSSNLHPSSSLFPQPSKTPNLIEKIRRREDKTLHQLALVTIAENGRPRVLIPDEVFQKSAEIHKDIIACYFNGRPPPFKHIQNVLDHLWGKGKRIEIHNNPLTRSMLVRIPSDYLGQRILEKEIWYVGDSMFHTAQWNSAHSASTPSLNAIPIWAYLHGVPLDLQHQEGLNFVAGLVGHPKETGDFTKNLVSLTVSHVKVAMDLTKPVPDIVEFSRQSGEVVEFMVTYPWLAPTCDHCMELGHISKNCLLLPPPAKQTAPAKEKQKETTVKMKESTREKQQEIVDVSISEQGRSETPTKDNDTTKGTTSMVVEFSNVAEPTATPTATDIVIASAPQEIVQNLPLQIVFPFVNSLPKIPSTKNKLLTPPSNRPLFSPIPYIVGLPAIRPQLQYQPLNHRASHKRCRSDPSLNTSHPRPASSFSDQPLSPPSVSAIDPTFTNSTISNSFSILQFEDFLPGGESSLSS